MKKITAILLTAGLILTLAACGKSQDTPAAADSSAKAESKSEAPAAETSESSEAEEQAGGAMLGGWTINDDETVAVLPDAVQEAFDKATEGLLGNDLTPVAYIGKQVVSGANYAILCKSTLVTKEPVTSYQVAIVYADLEGNAEVKNIADFNIGDYTEGDGADASALVGGWSTPEEYTVVNMPAEVQGAFDSALEGFVGNNLEPLAYLGSQVVSGTNYAILCHSSLVTKDPVNSIQVVTVYKDLEGKSQLKNICTIDPADFNQ